MTYLTRTHLEQALTPEQLRTTTIIRIALMMGVLFFYFAIFMIYSTRTPESLNEPDLELMNVLSLVHVVMAISVTMAAFFISELQLKKNLLSEETDPAQAAAKAIALHRTSTLLFMAPIEGAAFFGGTICIIGVTSGTMDLEPLYWLNAGSATLLFIVGMATFPTRERVLTTLEDAFVRM